MGNKNAVKRQQGSLNFVVFNQRRKRWAETVALRR